MSDFGLKQDEIDAIKSVFQKYHQVEEGIVYGSRAKGNFKASSDIDLSLKGENLDLSLLMKIEIDLDDLMMPYKIDVCIYDKITNPEFIEHIDRVGKSIYTQTPHKAQQNL